MQSATAWLGRIASCPGRGAVPVGICSTGVAYFGGLRVAIRAVVHFVGTGSIISNCAEGRRKAEAMRNEKNADVTPQLNVLRVVAWRHWRTDVAGLKNV